MKKIVSIFLLALYAVSVSASVVSVRHCKMLQGKLIISVFEGKDCCCNMAGQMNMDGVPLISEKVTKAGHAINVLQSNQVEATPNKCCSETVMQSRLAMNQLNNAGTDCLAGNLIQYLPSVLPFHLTYRPFLVIVDQKPSPTSKAPPPSIALYKLFQRFTYYG